MSDIKDKFILCGNKLVNITYVVSISKFEYDVYLATVMFPGCGPVDYKVTEVPEWVRDYLYNSTYVELPDDCFLN